MSNLVICKSYMTLNIRTETRCH